MITAVASALLDNVTTVLLIAPVTFVVCERLALPVAPYLIAEVFASNIGGTATLVGDPPNIIIASRAGLTFNDFLIHLAPLVVILMVIFIGLCRVMFRHAFRYDPERAAEVMRLEQREAIRDRRLLVAGPGRARRGDRGVRAPPGAALRAVGGRAARRRACSSRSARSPRRRRSARSSGRRSCSSWACSSWSARWSSTGVIGAVSQAAADATEGRLGLAAMVLLCGSGVLSAIVDNIPYVATMSPIVAELVPAHGDAGQVLWWALALGADLGGNATAIGASANVVDPRHRRAQQRAHQLLAVHPVRPRRGRGDDRGVRAVPVAALPLARRRDRAGAGRNIGTWGMPSSRYSSPATR